MVYDRNTRKTWWSYHDHGLSHWKHGKLTMIKASIFENILMMLWIMTTKPWNMATMPSSWHDHDHVSPWSCFDHRKIVAWLPVFPTPDLSLTLQVLEIEESIVITILLYLLSCASPSQNERRRSFWLGEAQESKYKRIIAKCVGINPFTLSLSKNEQK